MVTLRSLWNNSWQDMLSLSLQGLHILASAASLAEEVDGQVHRGDSFPLLSEADAVQLSSNLQSQLENYLGGQLPELGRAPLGCQVHSACHIHSLESHGTGFAEVLSACKTGDVHTQADCMRAPWPQGNHD